MSAMKDFIINATDAVFSIVGIDYDFCASMGRESDYHYNCDNAMYFSLLDAFVGKGDQDSFQLLLCQIFDTCLYSRFFVNSILLKYFDEFERSYFMSIVKSAASYLLSIDPEEYGDINFYPYIAELLSE